MTKEIKMDYNEYESLVENIKSLEEQLENNNENVVLVMRHIINQEGFHTETRKIYQIEQYEDVKGSIVQSLKGSDTQSHEETIRFLESKIHGQKQEINTLELKYKNKGVIDCLLGR